MDTCSCQQWCCQAPYTAHALFQHWGRVKKSLFTSVLELLKTVTGFVVSEMLNFFVLVRFTGNWLKISTRDCWLKRGPLRTMGCSPSLLNAESIVVDWITILLLYTYAALFVFRLQSGYFLSFFVQEALFFSLQLMHYSCNSKILVSKFRSFTTNNFHLRYLGLVKWLV